MLAAKVVDRVPVVQGCMAVLVGSCPLVAVAAVTGFSALATVRAAGCCLSHCVAVDQCCQRSLEKNLPMVVTDSASGAVSWPRLVSAEVTSGSGCLIAQAEQHHRRLSLR